MTRISLDFWFEEVIDAVSISASQLQTILCLRFLSGCSFARTDSKHLYSTFSDMKKALQTKLVVSEELFSSLARLGLCCFLKSFCFIFFNRRSDFGSFQSPSTYSFWICLVLGSFTSSAAQGYDTIPRPCFDDSSRYCSRCENTTRFNNS